MIQHFAPFFFFSLMGLSAMSAWAAEPVAIPNSTTRPIATNLGVGFNSLSAEDRKKLLASPEGAVPSSRNNGGLNLKDDSYCNELQRQIKRAQYAAPAWAANVYPERRQHRVGSRNDLQYGADSGTGLQYDERGRLEARYHSKCAK